MTTDLAELIERCIAAKEGDKEFALFFTPEQSDSWRAEIGNPVSAVSLGESNGEFVARGTNATEAVGRLLLRLECGQ